MSTMPEGAGASGAGEELALARSGSGRRKSARQSAEPRVCGRPGCRAMTEAGRFICAAHAAFYEQIREDLVNGVGRRSIVRPQLAASLCLTEGCEKVIVRGSDHCADHQW